MNEKILDLAGPIIILMIGLFASINCGRIGRLAKEQQSKIFGVKAGVRGYQLSFFIGGLLFVVFGILELFSQLR